MKQIKMNGLFVISNSSKEMLLAEYACVEEQNSYKEDFHINISWTLQRNREVQVD